MRGQSYCNKTLGEGKKRFEMMDEGKFQRDKKRCASVRKNQVQSSSSFSVAVDDELRHWFWYIVLKTKFISMLTNLCLRFSPHAVPSSLLFRSYPQMFSQTICKLLFITLLLLSVLLKCFSQLFLISYISFSIKNIFYLAH